MNEKERADIKTIARNAGISGLGDLFSAALIFITNIIMTRAVGASIYGTFVLTKSVALVAATLGSFGLHQGILHFVPFYSGKEDLPRAKGAVFSSTRLTAMFSFGTAACVFFLADPIANDIFHTAAMAPALRILAFSIPCISYSKLWLGGIQAFRALKYSVLVGKVIQPLIGLIALAILLLSGLKLYSLVFSDLASGFLAALLALYFLRKLFPPQWRKITPVSNRRDLLGFSSPLFLVDTLDVIRGRMDVLIIGIFLLSYHAGLYNAVVRVSMLLLIPLAAVDAIFAPMIAEYHGRGDLVSLGRNFKMATRWILSLSFPLCLLVMLFPAPLLSLFGPEFIGGSKALVILAGGQLVNAATGPVDYMIMMTGHSKLNLINAISLGLVNLILTLLLIPRFGIAGAAMAAATSVAAINLLRLAEVYRLMKIHPFRWDFLKPIAAGLVAAAFTYILIIQNRQQLSTAALLIGVIMLFIVYGGTILLLRLPEEEKLVLKTLVVRLRGKTAG